MRYNLLLISLTFFLAGKGAHAQNSDFGLLLGVSGPRSEVSTSTGYVRSSVGANVQLNYAWQVWQRAVDLYVELPLVLGGDDTSTVTPKTVSSFSGADCFFTPGARLKISPHSRVSFYGVLGAGLAAFGGNQVYINHGVTATQGSTVSAAMDFGGGIDFRLTRLLSLRFEGRDFVTKAGLGGADGHQHTTYQGGIGFHF